jgi:hypothetical protein
MRLRSFVPWIAGLFVASSLSLTGCGAKDDSDDAEFDADWVEDFENDADEDVAEEAEQLELDEVDDMDDVEILDDTSDTGAALSAKTLSTKGRAPKRAAHGPLSIIEEDPHFSGEQWTGADTRNYDLPSATAHVAEAKAIGADVVRVMLWWATVAPGKRELKKPDGFVSSKPDGYDWRYLDTQIEAARANNMKVMITATAGNMPYWASDEPSHCKKAADAGKAWSCSWKPNPKEYAKFVTAIGRHVKQKGYRIWAWTFVNEPNIGAFLSEEDSRIDSDNNAAMEVAFRYRRLWFAARKHLRKTAKVKARVLYGDMANNQKTKGETLDPSSGRWNIIPWSLCLQTEWNPDLLDGKYKCPLRPRKAHVHGVAFHPYASSASQAAYSVSFLQKLVDDAAQEGRITRGRGLYMTESGFLTAKGKDGAALGAGSIVTPAEQASAINNFEHELYKNKRVKSVSQYELVDEGRGSWDCGLRFAFGDVHKTDGSVVTGDFLEVVLGSHLLVRPPSTAAIRIEWAAIAPAPWSATMKWFNRTATGAEKPAYAAYRLGIDITKSGDEVTVWGHSRADSGAGFTIEGLFPSGAWQEITAVGTDSFGFGQKTIKLNGATAWRLRFGADLSRTVR